MIEVHECISFIQFACLVYREIKTLVSTFMSLINLSFKLFNCVLVRDVPEHHIGTLLVTCFDPFYEIIIQLVLEFHALFAQRQCRAKMSRLT